MGSAGHAFLAHTKALSPPASVGDGGWGMPPHPLAVRPGQRYWPRAGRRKLPFVVRRVSGEQVVGQRLDNDGRVVHLTAARLLATRDDGQGRHYAFSGHIPRRYATHAVVVALEDERATLVVPEWHPARPVVLPARQLPAGAVRVGAWFAAQADLSASSAPRLALAGFVAVEDPGPRRAHRPTWRPGDGLVRGDASASTPPVARRTALGRDCGDIVVALSPAEAAQWTRPADAAAAAPPPKRRVVVSVQRPPAVHRTGPTPKLAPGARLYLAAGGELLGYATVLGQRPLPNGDVFEVAGRLEAAEPVAPFAPFHNWRWRWWPR